MLPKLLWKPQMEHENGGSFFFLYQSETLLHSVSATQSVQQYRDFQGNLKELGAFDSNNHYSISLTVYNLSASQALLQIINQSLVLSRPKVFLQKALFSLPSFHMSRTYPLGPESENVLPTWSRFLHRPAQVGTIVLAVPTGALISSHVPRR